MNDLTQVYQIRPLTDATNLAYWDLERKKKYAKIQNFIDFWYSGFVTTYRLYPHSYSTSKKGLLYQLFGVQTERAYVCAGILEQSMGPGTK